MRWTSKSVDLLPTRSAHRTSDESKIEPIDLLCREEQDLQGRSDDGTLGN